MDNGELYRLFTEQLNNRMDRMENTIQNAVNNIYIVCKDHDNRIDQHEKDIAIMQDRQAQNESREKKQLTIIGILIPLVSGIVTFLWNKLKF